MASSDPSGRWSTSRRPSAGFRAVDTPGGPIAGDTALADAEQRLLGETRSSYDALGTYVFAEGDVDGDGRSDLVTYGGESFVYVHTAVVAGSALAGDNAATTIYPRGPQPLSGGDVDGDGLTDVVTAYYLENSYQGAVHVYTADVLGPGAFDESDATCTITGDLCSGFGVSTALVGDIDGDGAEELGAGILASEFYLFSLDDLR